MGIPVVIAANGRGICVRQVTSGAPVMTVAANGLGIPIVLGAKGIPFVVQGSNPAPTLGAVVLTPQASPTTYPPAPGYTFPVDAQVGDKFRIWTAATYADAVARTNLIINDATVTLTGVYATDKAAINAKLAGIASGTTWIGGRIERGSAIGYSSNIIQHGSAAAPALLSSIDFTNVEGTHLAGAFTANPCYIYIEGVDQDQFDLVSSGPATSFVLQWLADGVRSYSAPADQNLDNVYSFTLRLVGLNGVEATSNGTVTVSQVTLDAFTFTDVSNATTNTVYTSNTITIANLNVPSATATVAGGEYQLNGGSWVSAGSFSVTTGSTIKVRANSGVTIGSPVNVSLSVGNRSDTYTITLLQPFIISSTDKYVNAVVSNGGLTLAGASGEGIQNARTNKTIDGTSGTVFFDYTVDVGGSFIIGFGNASATLIDKPGAASANGTSLTFGSWGFELANNAGYAVQDYTGISGFGVGSKARASINLATKAVSFFVAADGVTFVQKGPTVTTPISTIYGMVGVGDANQLTADFTGLG